MSLFSFFGTKGGDKATPPFFCLYKIYTYITYLSFLQLEFTVIQFILGLTNYLLCMTSLGICC